MNKFFSTELLLPGAQNYPPVSIGELPARMYQTSIATTAEEVVAHLEDNPQIPGVILLDGSLFHSMIPRQQIFERLGHRYGVELFLRKPIVELQETVLTPATIVSSGISISDAASIALRRDTEHIYDPLVLEHENKTYSLLDMRILLQAQSLALNNANNVISNLNRIEQSLKAEIPLDAALDMIVDAVKRIAPFHFGTALIRPERWRDIYSPHPFLTGMDDNLYGHSLIRSIVSSRRSIHIEDVRQSPLWKSMDTRNRYRTWLGVPIFGARNFDGILSLGRNTLSPFSKNEMDMAQIFAELLSVAINQKSDEILLAELIKRKFL